MLVLQTNESGRKINIGCGLPTSEGADDWPAVQGIHAEKRCGKHAVYDSSGIFKPEACMIHMSKPHFPLRVSLKYTEESSSQTRCTSLAYGSFRRDFLPCCSGFMHATLGGCGLQHIAAYNVEQKVGLPPLSAAAEASTTKAAAAAAAAAAARERRDARI